MHMHMNFWWGTDIGDFFIKGFTINGSGQMISLCFSLFFLSIALEGLKVHRARSRAKTARENRRSASNENQILLSSNGNSQFRTSFIWEFLKGLKDVSIFAFHNILSYGVMLAVMLYNGYIFISVVLGAFIGYFLFGHISMKTNMENLQAIQTKIVCSSRCADSEDPCTSGTTPIISHCPTIVGESSSSGVAVMQRMHKSNSEDSSMSETSIDNVTTHECHK